MADKEGMVQYFYHSPASQLPIRDVLNQQGAGNKHEPHIEAGAENLLDSCYQRNVARFAQGERDYLFLVTRCANPVLKLQYRNQYVVGYIKKQEVGERQGRVFVRGDTKLFSFLDSPQVLDIFGFNFSRLHLNQRPYVDSEKTSRILDSFSGKTNILEDCIHEIDILDFTGITCHPDICGFADECSRYAVYHCSKRKNQSKQKVSCRRK
jgi:hypothetical protein